MNKNLMLLLFAGAIILSSCQKSEKNYRKASHILVIGIDGMGAHGLEMARTPNMDELMQNGAWSLGARTIVPSSSGPAWSSMITGASVERHGVGNNGWTVENKLLEPVFKGENDMFPTIFGETRKHIPDAMIGAFYHWGTLRNFFEKGVCNVSEPCDSENMATEMACKFLVENRPDFTFVHLDHVDHGGHHGGYRSEEYVKSIEKADSLVGVFISHLEEAEILEETVIFIVSDHGGLEKKHGGSHPDEMIVPFVISGKGVKKGYKIEQPVFIYDLAPTVAWLFGFELNEWITGAPLVDAFQN
jgi:predicted AlkP superfamily pyrophosphatase or phosphodiesterase